MTLVQQLTLLCILLVLITAGVVFVLVQVGRIETPKIIVGAATLLLLGGIGLGVVAATSPVDPHATVTKFRH